MIRHNTLKNLNFSNNRHSTMRGATLVTAVRAALPFMLV
jgi:hypothetical protein